ncbi:MAG: nucleotidyltransferase family protein [Candidatus Diapherotrites archaeon]
MKAIVLAAGYATRLYPMTKEQSKALLDVKGKPIISYIVEKICELKEVNEVIVVSNDKFFYDFEDWAKKNKCTVPLKLLNDHSTSEENRLGAIGDIAYVIEELKIDEDVLVVAGDNLFDFNLEKMTKTSEEKNASAIALYRFPSKEEIAGKFGVVELDPTKKIIGFEEKPEKPRTNYAATACYLFRRSDLLDLQEYLKAFSGKDDSGKFIAYLSSKKDVFGVLFSGQWFDIGSFEALGKARSEFNGGK